MKFKNYISVKGSRNLLEAFAKELEEIGYKPDHVSGFNCWREGKTHLLLNIDDITNGVYGYYNNAGLSSVYILSLPLDWERALKLATEKKNELEVGKWYKNNKGALVCYQDKGDNYGFDNDGDWSNTVWVSDSKYWEEVDKDQVKKRLIAEAERRGFKKGVRYNSLRGTPFGHEDANTEVSLLNFREKAFALVTSYGVVFYNGKWAEIVEDRLTVAGYDVEDNCQGDQVKIGCTYHEVDDLKGLCAFIEIAEDHGQIEIIYEGKRIKDDLKKVFDKYL